MSVFASNYYTDSQRDGQAELHSKMVYTQNNDKHLSSSSVWHSETSLIKTVCCSAKAPLLSIVWEYYIKTGVNFSCFGYSTLQKTT